MAGLANVAKKANVKEADVQAVLDAIKDIACSGEKVTIQKYGTFSLRTRKARAGRNPQTGKAIQIAEKKAFVFSESKGKTQK